MEVEKIEEIKVMKVGVIGVGHVGGQAALQMALRDSCRELVLMDADRQLAVSQALDIAQTSALVGGPRVRAGVYQDLAGVEVVVLAPGINEKAGGADKPGDKEGRLRLLDANVPVFRDIVPKALAAAPGAVLLVATNPLDVMTELTRRLAGGRAVFGTGTFLDSVRFKTALAERLDVAPECVSAAVVGEHGLSSVLLWSAVTVGGVPLKRYLVRRGIEEKALKQAVGDYVKQGNLNIIRGKGASEFAIGTVIARVVESVLRDERIVMPCSCYSDRYGVTLSLLRRVGRGGVLDEFEMEVSQEEQEGLQRSAGALKAAIDRLDSASSGIGPEDASRVTG
jgi:L-lactate dehydrogenase